MGTDLIVQDVKAEQTWTFKNGKNTDSLYLTSLKPKRKVNPC